MGKKLPYTPNSRIRQALRQLFLRSREHSAALKAANYTCRCGAKQSRAKGKEVYVEVHHKAGVGNWEKMFNLIRTELLCAPDLLQVLCKRCHQAEHETKGKTHGHEPAGDVPVGGNPVHSKSGSRE